MTHEVLILHYDRNKEDALHIMADAIDFYDADESGLTWIYFRSGKTVKVAESPEEISKMLKLNTGNISLTETRSEQERWLNGE